MIRVNLAFIICDRCRRPIKPWPLRRANGGNLCSEPHWQYCIRNDRFTAKNFNEPFPVFVRRERVVGDKNMTNWIALFFMQQWIMRQCEPDRLRDFQEFHFSRNRPCWQRSKGEINQMKMDLKIRLEAESMALADYQKALGKEITVTMITGYQGDDSVDVDGVLIRVRVIETPENDLCHWVDEYLDPYWNVEPLDTVPLIEGLRSFWTFGPSYRVVDDTTIFSVENNQAVKHGAIIG
jgi:hypothetical protein